MEKIFINIFSGVKSIMQFDNKIMMNYIYLKIKNIFLLIFYFHNIQNV